MSSPESKRPPARKIPTKFTPSSKQSATSTGKRVSNGHCNHLEEKNNRRPTCGQEARHERSRSLRRLRRPLRPRNSHGRARRTRARIQQSEARSEISKASGRIAAHLRRTPHSALLRPATHEKARRRKDLSQARRSPPHRRA